MNRRTLFKRAATMLTALITVKTVKAEKTPLFHDHVGSSYIPNEATYLLQKGEEVPKPNEMTYYLEKGKDGNRVYLYCDGKLIGEGIGKLSPR